MPSNIRGIEQERAKAAYIYVKSVVDSQPDKVKTKYKSGAKKIPVLIKTNGLGQSLAFIKNRDDGWKIIYQQLTEWLQKKELIPNGTIDLVYAVIKKESDYRRITVECISFLNWLRRFVDGLMEDVKENNS